MPVEFLSAEQVSVYGRFAGELTRAELDRFFLHDATALDLIAHKRGQHTSLGMGVQIGTVRYLGLFLEDRVDPGHAASTAPVDHLVARRYRAGRPDAGGCCGG